MHILFKAGLRVPIRVADTARHRQAKHMINQPDTPRTLGVCDTQPVSAEGLRALLRATSGVEFAWSAASPGDAAAQVRTNPPSVVLLDRGFGVQTLIEWMSDRRAESFEVPVVVWGSALVQSECLRFLQAGARGVVQKSAPPATVVACIETVASGGSWLDESVFSTRERDKTPARSELTARELQVLSLVEQGLRNKEIAAELNISPGTVKIHVKHIFEKTGVRGRLGLALNAARTQSSRAGTATGLINLHRALGHGEALCDLKRSEQVVVAEH